MEKPADSADLGNVMDGFAKGTAAYFQAAACLEHYLELEQTARECWLNIWTAHIVRQKVWN